MTERDSDLFKMVEQVLEIKDKRITEVKERLKNELLSAHLGDNKTRYTGNPENIQRLTDEVVRLEKNRCKFWESMYEIGFLVDEVLW